MSGAGVSTIADVECTTVGGASVARLTLEETAALMLRLAREPKRAAGPFYFTSVNGEVLARRRFDPHFAPLVDGADLVSADGQPLVLASRWLSSNPLPERVATTDLFPVVAEMAEAAGVSFYLMGASEAVNRAAFEATKRRHPRLDIRGRAHGYAQGPALERQIAAIDALAPDILWLGLGVPYEQEFVRRHASALSNVKLIKTSGGLFDFVAGARSRAPAWMRKSGLEWAYRMALEPRRLSLRYLATNPIALALLVTRTR